ncbi:MAG: MerR family transcriptional regulator [Firmicutes bacterium]|nr:MerR family transcriptional regulator [Bacillota bacterium]
MSVTGKTLSETAMDVGVEPSTIKYWCEEFSNFIRPARTPGGHRRFSEEDIRDLRYLRQLLHFQNFSIKQAKDYLNQPGNRPSDTDMPETQIIASSAAAPTAASLAQDVCRYLEHQMEVIAEGQVKAIQLALDQTAATVLDEVRELESEHFTQWSRLVEHTASKTNEKILAAVDELRRTPQDVEEIKRMYAEAKDRWLIEEAKVRMEIQRLKHELSEVQNQSLWQRLIWAIFGRGKQFSEMDNQYKNTDLNE